MFQKAERRRVKPKIAISGPSGSGKTFGALTLATALGKKIAVIDTENDSASTYADRFEFDTVCLRPAYTVDKFIQAVTAAVRGGYDVVVIDSISHEWVGDGGLLSKKEELDAIKGTNQFANWAPISKDHERFKSLILNSDIAIIATMRSKQDYVLSQNDKGKQVPEKVGLAPVQREGMEYEFMTVFDVDMNHVASVSKDRTSLFDGKRFKITSETGKELADWLASAKAPAEPTPAPVASQDDVPLNFTKPDAPTAKCESCGSALKLHPTKVGWICPNAKEKGDQHTRMTNDQHKAFVEKPRVSA